MSYQEEERTRLRRQSSKQAIALAMQGRWQEVVAANLSLLESFPTDVDAYNRLARAYMELGDYALAKTTYEKAVEFDPYNTIARKNLSRLAHLGEMPVSAKAGFARVEPQQFIEEVGKAGVVNLHRLAPPGILAKTVAGSQVTLKIDGANLVVENGRGEYLGQVELKHGPRLIKLIERGNQYSGTIVSSTAEAVTVMIREVFQHPSQVGRLSFPPKGSEGFRPYIGDRMIRRELEYEGALSGQPGYTIIGGEEAEILPEEFNETDDADETDDEADDEE